MSYVQKNLSDKEDIVYKANIHWIIFVPAFIWGMISLLCLLCYNTSTSENSEGILFYAIISCAITIYCLIKELLEKYTSEYILTTKRLIFKTGIIARNTKEILLTKYEGVLIRQSVLGRLLRYGTIIATTGGITNKYKNIENPTAFSYHINEQIQKSQS